MVLYPFIVGFAANMLTGFDDTITKLPIITTIARTRLGRTMFCLGVVSAIIVTLMFSGIVSTFLSSFAYYRYVSAFALVVLAVFICSDSFGVHKPQQVVEKKMIAQKRIRVDRMIALYGLGFGAAIATVLDDIVVYASLFATMDSSFIVGIGIVSATIVQLGVVVFFARQVDQVPYKEEIAGAGLILIALLIASGVM